MPEQETKEIINAIDTLERYIEKGYGKKCKEFHYSCFVCQIYSAMEVLKDAVLLQDGDLRLGLLEEDEQTSRKRN